jgi:hypothetical protein
LNNNQKIAMGVTPAVFAVLFAVAFVPADTFSGSAYSDDAQFGGVFTFTHRDADGNVIQTFKQHNEVTNEGMECVSDLIFATTDCTGETTFNYIALGTSSAAVDETHTALTTEVGGCTRLQDGTVALDTGTTNQRTATISVTFSGAGCEGSAFAEVGVFDAVTTGNMLARALISPTINLGSGDTLQIDYDIVLNNS